MSADPGYLTSTITRWRADARIFVRECIGATPDPWQDHVLALVSKTETRRVAMKACKGPGKTAVLAWVILWFLACHVESKVGCTSITEGNIDTNLWPELWKWMSRSEFLKTAFVWTKSAVTRKGNPNWFAVKRTWPKSGDAEQQALALAGLHADDVMFVLDESGGIPQAVMVTAEAVLSAHVLGHRALVVQSGNPTHTTGPLHRACTVDRALWAIVTITGDPDNPMRSSRISLEWAREQIASYGRDNPWVMVNVLGEFPPSSINALLGVEEVERAMARHYRISEYDWADKRIGVDCARFGDDRTVLFPRQGIAAFTPVVMRQRDTTAIAARCAKGFNEWHADLILWDETGHWGHGAYDQLLVAGYPMVPVVSSDPAIDKRFFNRRAEMAFECAKWVKGGGALPKIPELVPELTEPTYTFVGGKFRLEEKDQIKARLGRSPDLADALGETFAIPDMPGKLLLQGKAQAHATTAFDPFAADGQLAEGHAETDFNPFEYQR